MSAAHPKIAVIVVLSLLAILIVAVRVHDGRRAGPTTATSQKSQDENPPTAAIDWLAWSDAVFAQARRENKCVVMDLEAVWCHWCHVMDDVTYRDPAVVGLMQKNFLAIKVDQDARPDISARYEKYGWPGTIIFAPDGTEIVKRQGYITPGAMESLLRAVVDDPTPGPSARETPLTVFSASDEMPLDLRHEVEKQITDRYDPIQSGWGTIHKYLNAGNIEYCLNQAAAGDANAAQMARHTLDPCRKLIDPVWGGLYQYSTDGDWDHPHYERIMAFQSDGIRIYALAYRQFNDPAYLKAATDIARFLRTFLRSPEGAFYVSMDADAIPGDQAGSEHYATLDDAARRKIGIPRIDRHLYARENGWAIAALVEMYLATHDAAYLADARTAADWVMAHRSLPDGGFRHDEQDSAGPYLADTLAMGQAFAALYRAEHRADDLDRAHAAGAFIATHFPGVPVAPGATEVAGVITALPQMNQRPYLELEENAGAVRLALALFALTQDPAMAGLAQRAKRYLATPAIAKTFGEEGAVLLAFAPQASTKRMGDTAILRGTVYAEKYFGPPNYGENPDTDAKEIAYILRLVKAPSPLRG